MSIAQWFYVVMNRNFCDASSANFLFWAQLAIAFTSVWEDHVGISVGHKEMVILDPLWILQQLTEDPVQLLEDM